MPTGTETLPSEAPPMLARHCHIYHLVMPVRTAETSKAAWTRVLLHWAHM